MTSSSPRKLVLITGCTRGLGRALVDEFARVGWRVVGCARDTKRLAELAAARPTGHFLGCDVADDTQVARFAATVLSELGVPDLVVNNAALINRNAPLWRVPADEFARVIDVNIKGVAAIMREFLPAMLERGGGVIVNLSSGWGRSTSPEVAPYCATKFAVEGLTRAVAQETDGRVAIVALNPGVIDTDMLRSCFGGDASVYPKPAAWAARAVGLLAGLGAAHNGRSLDLGED